MTSTREHVDELEARRQKRHGLPAATEPPAPKPAEATRELWRDIVAYGPAPAVPTPRDATDLESSTAPATDVGSTTTTRQLESPVGEGVDELVRRVQAGSQTRAGEPLASSRRRPIGSADLAHHPGPARRARGRLETEGRIATTRPHRRRVGIAAAAMLVGVVVVVAMSGVVGQRSRQTVTDAASTTTRLDSTAGLLDRVPVSLTTITQQVETIARRAAAHSPRLTGTDSRPRAHKTRRAASTQPRTPVHTVAPPTTSTATTSPSTSTSTSVATPVRQPTSSSSTTTSSHTSSSQPAGPTDAGPLGGIGSCVDGC